MGAGSLATWVKDVLGTVAMKHPNLHQIGYLLAALSPSVTGRGIAALVVVGQVAGAAARITKLVCLLVYNMQY